MKSMSVLKAASAVDSAVPRIVLGGESVKPLTSVTAREEPGVWISQSELHLLKRSSLEQGRKEGEELGRRAAQQAAQQQAERDARERFDVELKVRQDRHAKEQGEKWRGLATALAVQAQAVREQLKAEVTEWTFIAVARLLGQQARDHAESAVRQVLADAQLDGPLTVLLHAQDLVGLQASQAIDPSAWPQGLSFAASDRVSLGGCLIESGHQTLDARLDVQLALLREALDAARHQRSESEC